MIEISPVTSTYPIKKPNKVIRDGDKQQSAKEEMSEKKEDKEEASLNEQIEQHIDEII